MAEDIWREDAIAVLRLCRFTDDFGDDVMCADADLLLGYVRGFYKE